MGVLFRCKIDVMLLCALVEEFRSWLYAQRFEAIPMVSSAID